MTPFIQELQGVERVLYVIPFFPEAYLEVISGVFPHFPVDWEDPQFRALLRKSIAPKKPIPPLHLPKDRISVAIHVRTGGGKDNRDSITRLPLKFTPETFFVKALIWLYDKVERAPLYVHIFTDDRNPKAMKERFKIALGDLNITFGCRESGNRPNAHVLEDFFSMTQCSCAIYGQSNYAIVASLLADYQIEISPRLFQIRGKQIVISQVAVKERSAEGAVTNYTFPSKW